MNCVKSHYINFVCNDTMMDVDGDEVMDIDENSEMDVDNTSNMLSFPPSDSSTNLHDYFINLLKNDQNPNTSQPKNSENDTETSKVSNNYISAENNKDKEISSAKNFVEDSNEVNNRKEESVKIASYVVDSLIYNSTVENINSEEKNSSKNTNFLDVINHTETEISKKTPSAISRSSLKKESHKNLCNSTSSVLITADKEKGLQNDNCGSSSTSNVIAIYNQNENPNSTNVIIEKNSFVIEKKNHTTTDLKSSLKTKPKRNNNLRHSKQTFRKDDTERNVCDASNKPKLLDCKVVINRLSDNIVNDKGLLILYKAKDDSIMLSKETDVNLSKVNKKNSNLKLLNKVSPKKKTSLKESVSLLKYFSETSPSKGSNNTSLEKQNIQCTHSEIQEEFPLNESNVKEESILYNILKNYNVTHKSTFDPSLFCEVVMDTNVKKNSSINNSNTFNKKSLGSPEPPKKKLENVNNIKKCRVLLEKMPIIEALLPQKIKGLKQRLTICFLCKNLQCFLSKNALANHYVEVHLKKTIINVAQYSMSQERNRQNKSSIKNQKQENLDKNKSKTSKISNVNQKLSCNKFFKTSPSLKTFKCKICLQTFITNLGLSNHVKKKICLQKSKNLRSKKS